MAEREGPKGPREWAKEALVAMSQRGIPPTPENYLVWYTVARDANPTLSRVIRVLDTQSAPYDEERCHELHSRFFGDAAQRNALEALGNRIDQHLVDVANLLASVNDGTRTYGGHLADAGTALTAGLDAAELDAILERLRSETRTLCSQADAWTARTREQSREITRLREDLAAARAEAETDALTKVGNRKRFDRRLRELAAASCEQGQSLSLLLCDVDHFKRFNDTYGHSLGDRVLSLVATRLQAVAGDRVEVFRYGGEEFAALAVGYTLAESVEIAETIRRSISSARISRRSDGEALGRITMSVGLTQYEPGEPLGRFVERSDAALYAAKNAGRNRTSVKRAKVDSRAA